MRRPSACFLIISTLVAGLAGCGEATPAGRGERPPTPVRTAAIELSTEASPVMVSGILARRTEADLAFKIGGIIENVAVRAGDIVAKDQVLARLRSDEIDAQVAAARSAADKARRNLVRMERLQNREAASLESLQDARTGLELAEAQLRIAEFNQRHAVIVAPAAGRILRRLAEPNEMVTPGAVIVGFANDAEGWIVRSGLAERDAARIRVNDVATLVFGATTAATGRVIRISESVDAATRTTAVEIELASPPTGARSGSVMGVTLIPPEVPARPVVPAAALIEGAGGTAGLFILEAGGAKVKRLAVQVEALQGERAFLRTPLPRDARLVVSGGEYLSDGQVVAEVE